MPGNGALAYATSALLWVRGPCFFKPGVVVSAGPLVLGLVRDSGGCPGLTELLCTRAVVPDDRCAFALPHWQWHGVGVHALLGLVCGRMLPDVRRLSRHAGVGRAPLVLCVLGDRLLRGRDVRCAPAQHGLRAAPIVEQGREEKGGGVMRQFGMNEIHEEAAH